MLAFLYLTLLLGVSLSQFQAAGDEVEGVNGLDVDQEGTDLSLQHPRSKRFICSLFCRLTGGTCLAAGQPTTACDYTQNFFCIFDPCNCCQSCATALSPCGLFGGVCKKKGGCDPEQFADTLIPCKDLNQCSCCRKCTTPTTCTNAQGTAVCGTYTAMNTKPEFFLNTAGRCQQGQSCFCFNKCDATKKCTDAGGSCIHKEKNCPNKLSKYLCGCKDTSNCACCAKKGSATETALGCKPTP